MFAKTEPCLGSGEIVGKNQGEFSPKERLQPEHDVKRN